jgi:hypothetical protein
VDEQDSRGHDRLGRVRLVLDGLFGLLRRGDRMLDDPADVLGLETKNGHQRLSLLLDFGLRAGGFSLEARSEADHAHRGPISRRCARGERATHDRPRGAG